MNYKELAFDLLARLSSRKFIAFFSLMLVLAGDNFGLKLDPEIRNDMVKLVAYYLLAEGTPDAIRAYNESKV